MRKTINPARPGRQLGKSPSSLRNQKSALSVSGIARQKAGTDNHARMTQNEWQRRIQRAEELGAQYSFRRGNPALLCGCRALSGTFLQRTRRTARRPECREGRRHIGFRPVCAAAASGSHSTIWRISVGCRNRTDRLPCAKRRTSCGTGADSQVRIADSLLE
jgi:hypothetical protein